MKKKIYLFLLIALTSLLVGCNFHLQGETKLAPPLHRLYLQTSDPYSHLSRNLQQYLRMSGVQLVSSPNEAETILLILSDSTAQDLLSVNGTQQTRQYNLIATVVFEITTAKGQTILAPQTLTEKRAITVQSDQILGSSNEASLFYQQMHRTLAYEIMNRIASKEVTRLIMQAFHAQPQTSIQNQPQ